MTNRLVYLERGWPNDPHVMREIRDLRHALGVTG
jgi:hypothetical protein